MELFGREHNQKMLRYLHNRGIEMTPDDLAAKRKAVYAAIRQRAEGCGFDVPDEDEKLFYLIRYARRQTGQRIRSGEWWLR